MKSLLQFIKVCKRKIEKHINLFLTKIYIILRVEELIFFFYFCIHRYRAEQFEVFYVRDNFKILIRLKEGEILDSSKKGKLRIRKGKWAKIVFSLKNMFLFGACQSRVIQVLFFTFLSESLELNNPLNKTVFKVFINKKIALLKTVLEKIGLINGKSWDRHFILAQIDLFYRNSLVQQKILDGMGCAFRDQKQSNTIQDIKEAIDRGIYPLLITRGYSGAYWMRGTNRQIIGIFKPQDEEIHAPNNPIGPSYQGALGKRKTRLGCRVGESAHHEVGAFLVDAFLGFGIVPNTYYASFTHRGFFLAREDRTASIRLNKTKIGSFQEFVEGFVPLHDLSQEEWKWISLEEFQLLVVLDLIVGNTDRNSGNLLIGEGKIAAVDHGLCFPDWVGDALSYWYWSYFEQGKQPLYPALLKLLEQFPLDALGNKLRKQCYISLPSIHRMRERIALFTEGARAGFSPEKLEGLMQPEYLSALFEHNRKLREIAAHQVQSYSKKL